MNEKPKISEKTFEYEPTPKLEINRLNQIAEIEANLRQEKAFILRERPWYLKPGNWIAITAIVISILLFFLNYQTFRETKELSLSYSRIDPLVSFTTIMKSRAKITFDDKSIDNLWISTIYIQNTGSKAISKDDFKDGPIEIELSVEHTPNKKPSVRSTIPLLLDVAAKSSAGQKKDIIKILSHENPAKFTYLPSLLNEGEKVELEVYLSDARSFSISVKGKFLDGTITNFGLLEGDLKPHKTSSDLKTIFTEINRLFKFKWITVIALFLLFIGSATVSFIFWDEFMPDDFSEYSIAAIPVVFTALFLLMLVLSIYY